MEKEKNNKGVIIVLSILIILLAVLCVLFATGTVSLKNNSSGNNQQVNNSEKTETNFDNNISEGTKNEESDIIREDRVTYDNVSNLEIDDELLNSFKLLATIPLQIGTYCGKNSKGTDKFATDGIAYYESSEFDSYNELYNYFLKYATNDVLTIKELKLDKNNYIESEGKLYCSFPTGKGGPVEISNYEITITSATNDKIVATGIVNEEAMGEHYDKHIFDINYVKDESNNWIISKFAHIKIVYSSGKETILN